MGAAPFLSEEWIEQATALRQEFEGRSPAAPSAMRMNLVVTTVPFGDGDIQAHIDTSSGQLELDFGHLDEADVKLTLDYDTAKAIVVDQDQQKAMAAFMGGRIKVEGDMSKLLAMQGAPVDPVQIEIAERLKAITA